MPCATTVDPLLVPVGALQVVVATSRKLSKLLRHKMHERGLFYRSDGYARLSDVLKTPGLQGVNVQLVRAVVADNDKQRFSMVTLDDGELWIRANQGHSIPGIKQEDLLEPLKDIPEVCVHGTYRAAWLEIQRQVRSRFGSSPHRLWSLHRTVQHGLCGCMSLPRWSL